MESQTQPNLPIIEFSRKNLTPGSETWLSAAKQVCHALEEYGCFIIQWDELISSNLNDQIYSAFQGLFDLPKETKFDTLRKSSDQPFRGIYTNNPSHEGISLGDVSTMEAAQHLTNQLWPLGNELFRDSIDKITKIMMDLDRTVMKMIFQNYGVEKYYEDHMGSMEYVTGSSKYENPERTEEYLGLFGHTDKSFSTVLHQNGVHGLEIQTKDGRWIAFDPQPPSHSLFIYLASDAFKAWSNKRVHSCYHQVMMRGGDTRISIGLFTFHKGILQVPDELVDEKHPMRYKSFNHHEFRNKFEQLAVKKIKHTIKDHCGV